MSLDRVCRRALVALTAASLSAAVTTTAVGTEDAAGRAAAAAPTTVLRLTFDAADYTGEVPRFPNSGDSRLAVTMSALDGGRLAQGRARVSPRTNKAVRTPRHDAGVEAPRAVIRVVDRRGADDLDPGGGRLVFGADFSLDRDSEAHDDGSTDNGNNLVQRGLFNQVSQYKIQVDGAVVSCRIKGRAGTALIASTVHIVPERWYRARCQRQASLVTLALTWWKADGTPVRSLSAVSTRTGRLSPASPNVPFSIGGKLNNTGEVLADADQFNGRIDNVVLRTP